MAGRNGNDIVNGGLGDDLCVDGFDFVEDNDSVNGGPGDDTGAADDGDEVLNIEDLIEGSCSAG